MRPDPTLEDELARIRRVAWRMDALVMIPGTNYSLGLDNILGLIPVVGDAMAIAPSIWIVHRAHKIGATPGAIAVMILNLIADFVIGSIPIIGDAFDVIYNANIRNYRLLERNLAERAARARPVRPDAPQIEALPGS